VELVKPSYKILTPDSHLAVFMEFIEAAGRTCYKSEDRITEGSAEKFVKMILNRGHESVIEHCSISVRFVIDRGVSHELVRHRLASYSQESSRFCDYGSGHIKFIIPPWVEDIPAGVYHNDEELPQGALQVNWLWAQGLLYEENRYKQLRGFGWTPEKARSVLGNSLKTEIVSTMNLRTWRWVFGQRAINKAAHPQMREVMIPLHEELAGKLPAIFKEL
jgi:thymidylate synthase (FAD)